MIDCQGTWWILTLALALQGAPRLWSPESQPPPLVFASSQPGSPRPLCPLYPRDVAPLPTRFGLLFAVEKYQVQREPLCSTDRTPPHRLPCHCLCPPPPAPAAGHKLLPKAYHQLRLIPPSLSLKTMACTDCFSYLFYHPTVPRFLLAKMEWKVLNWSLTHFWVHALFYNKRDIGPSSSYLLFTPGSPSLTS